MSRHRSAAGPQRKPATPPPASAPGLTSSTSDSATPSTASAFGTVRAVKAACSWNASSGILKVSAP